LKVGIVVSPEARATSDIVHLARLLRDIGSELTIVIGNVGLSPRKYLSLGVPNPHFLSGVEDDIIITKDARSSGRLLDGREEVVGGRRVWFVSGLDPHQSMELLMRRYGRGGPDMIISYHPPHGCGDLIACLGVRGGLVELAEFIEEVKPEVVLCRGRVSEVCAVRGATVLAFKPGSVVLLEFSEKLIRCRLVRVS